jgi:superfamily II DNA or RNA helicase
MENFQRAIRTGDLVIMRRLRWRVIDIRTYEQCQLVAVSGIGPANAGAIRHFLLPFDTVDRFDRPVSLRVVRRRRWRRAFRALLASHTPPGGLRAASRARIDLLPHQLEPALAVLGGRGMRLLLADEVGLGKTIQAGLVVAELRERGLAERVLILTPAGLREQWASELSDRFRISAAVLDFRNIRQRMAGLPVGGNPWSTEPVAIASIDYVKRPEVLHPAASPRWDILVVDEAHGAPPGSDRYAAHVALATRTPYVLLLTATPHSGDRVAFDALCRTGAHGDPLLVFRRTRADVKLANRRRLHRLYVRPCTAEARMHALLTEFTRAVRAEHRSDEACLALAVLHKRALSSASSLHLSIARRLAVLGDEPEEGGHQLSLSFVDDGGELDARDDRPAWADDLSLADNVHERRLLLRLDETARAARSGETKIAAIKRLLARTAERIVIFTEYRDTLLHVRDVLGEPAAVLHGGLSREERAAALHDFTRGRQRILLATDAAGEGLNLHERCRTVVNLELPWNPVRLEQRIGRVDRIGQRQVVHAFHLIARGTAEESILERLRSRITRAQQDIAAADPIADERAVARLVVDERSDEEEPAAVHGGGAETPAPDRVILRLEREAAVETERLADVRARSCPPDAAAQTALETAGVWMTRARRRSTRLWLGKRLLVLMRADYEDGHGRTSDSTLVPLAIEVTDRLRVRDRRDLDRLLRSIAHDLRAEAERAASTHRHELEAVVERIVEARRARERAIAQAVLAVLSVPVQFGLFDRRTERESLAVRAVLDEAATETASRLASCDRAAMVVPRPPRPLLILAP